jgi:Flp pilus assembly pilin Flp
MKSFLSPSRMNRGQGLVEYAIILSLVAIVVIGVMKLLGPKVGNTYSSIDNSLAADVGADVGVDEPVDTGDWTFAANENGVVNVPGGVYQIQYGANGQYFYQTFTGPTSVNCNNATFGDPIIGTVKSCSLKQQN